MYEEYGELAQFLIVYVKEAHPADAWAIEVNPRVKYINDPTTLLERCRVATTCTTDLGLSIPCLVDDMEDSTADAYKGFPVRGYLIGMDGRIAYQEAPGPWGFKPNELAEALRAELVRIGALENGG